MGFSNSPQALMMDKKQQWLQDIGYPYTVANYWWGKAGVHLAALGVAADGSRGAIVDGLIPARKIPIILREFDVVYTWGDPPVCWLARNLYQAVQEAQGIVDKTTIQGFKPMKRVRINLDAFMLVGLRGPVTPSYLANRLGIKLTSAATWLSKWKSRGYLVASKNVAGQKVYSLSDKDWTELTDEAE